jgi:hypothetical protein
MTDFQREEVARMESRAHSCEARFESLHLDEIDWKLERKRLRAELDAAIEQRDEARRLHCVEITRESMNPKRFTPEWAAKQLGWDCFAQEGGGA